jgi:hypothetical protein
MDGLETGDGITVNVGNVVKEVLLGKRSEESRDPVGARMGYTAIQGIIPGTRYQVCYTKSLVSYGGENHEQ